MVSVCKNCVRQIRERERERFSSKTRRKSKRYYKKGFDLVLKTLNLVHFAEGYEG